MLTTHHAELAAQPAPARHTEGWAHLQAKVNGRGGQRKAQHRRDEAQAAAARQRLAVGGRQQQEQVKRCLQHLLSRVHGKGVLSGRPVPRALRSAGRLAGAGTPHTLGFSMGVTPPCRAAAAWHAGHLDISKLLLVRYIAAMRQYEFPLL